MSFLDDGLAKTQTFANLNRYRKCPVQTRGRARINLGRARTNPGRDAGSKGKRAHQRRKQSRCRFSTRASPRPKHSQIQIDVGRDQYKLWDAPVLTLDVFVVIWDAAQVRKEGELVGDVSRADVVSGRRPRQDYTHSQI